MAYNRRRWGSDGWTQGLRASGRKSGAMFRDWRWWPNTLKVPCPALPFSLYTHSMILIQKFLKKKREKKENKRKKGGTTLPCNDETSWLSCTGAGEGVHEGNPGMGC